MYNYNLTEEIARWAFEIKCIESEDWFVAFTNPTAGPWKTIKGLDDEGKEGEVYRFGSKEPRPDIVLVSDRLQLIIIFEAKDSIGKLTASNQASKSIEVVNTLCEVLKSKTNNEYWGERANYPVITGLLWGAETPSNQNKRDETFDEYHTELENYSDIVKDIIIGIETRRDENTLTCLLCAKVFNEVQDSCSLDELSESFNIPIIE